MALSRIYTTHIPPHPTYSMATTKYEKSAFSSFATHTSFCVYIRRLSGSQFLQKSRPDSSALLFLSALFGNCSATQITFNTLLPYALITKQRKERMLVNQDTLNDLTVLVRLINSMEYLHSLVPNRIWQHCDNKSVTNKIERFVWKKKYD
jgi:hypothetical protein